MPTSSQCSAAQETVRKCKVPLLGKCVRSAKGTEVDAGSFAVERLAKTGDALVTKAVDADRATKIDVVPEERKTLNFRDKCPRLKGGGEAKCRVQMTTMPDGSGMAVRLCGKGVEQDGHLVRVVSAAEAKRVSDEFCICKEKSDAAKCAKMLGAKEMG